MDSLHRQSRKEEISPIVSLLVLADTANAVGNYNVAQDEQALRSTPWSSIRVVKCALLYYDVINPHLHCRATRTAANNRRWKRRTSAPSAPLLTCLAQHIICSYLMLGP